MKKIIYASLAAFLAGAVATCIGIYIFNGVIGLNTRGQKIAALNDARRVFIASQTYALDQLSSTGRISYPTSLEALFEGKYLDQDDRTKLAEYNRFIFPLGSSEISPAAVVIPVVAIFDDQISLYPEEQLVKPSTRKR